jgi:hypothetical protein
MADAVEMDWWRGDMCFRGQRTRCETEANSSLPLIV